jgi:hypothetical protein
MMELNQSIYLVIDFERPIEWRLEAAETLVVLKEKCYRRFCESGIGKPAELGS